MYNGSNGTINKIFGVNTQGAYIKGEVRASSGEIAGWKIDQNSLSNGSTALYSSDQSNAKTIADELRSDWRLIAGNGFGVTSSGSLYLSGGKLGPFTLNKDGIYVQSTSTEKNYLSVQALSGGNPYVKTDIRPDGIHIGYSVLY